MLSSGSFRAGVSSGPLLRHRSLTSKRHRLRGYVAIGVVVFFFFISLFLVEIDDNSKNTEQRFRNVQNFPSVSIRKASPDGRSRPTFSLVKRRSVPTNAKHKLRVYIYPDVVPPALNRNLRGEEGCWNGYSATEVLVPELIATTTVFTLHGELADFYLVPIASECFVTSEIKRGIDHSKAHKSLNAHFARTMDAVQANYPYWAASEGRDHLFIFPSERGAMVLDDDNLNRIKKSIFLTGLQQRDEEWRYFNRWKDIVLPPAMSLHYGNATLPAPTDVDHPRSTFLYFRGIIPGIEDRSDWGLRAALDLHLKKEPGVLFREPDEGCDRQCALAEMAQSTFCLVPDGGVEGWSLRLFDSIMQGCVPVLLADRWELPFQELLDWARFSVKVLEKEADELLEILRGIPQSAVEAKAAELGKVRHSFRWHDELRRFDALDSLYQMLVRRVRYMRNSPYRFWTQPSRFG